MITGDFRKTNSLSAAQKGNERTNRRNRYSRATKRIDMTCGGANALTATQKENKLAVLRSQCVECDTRRDSRTEKDCISSSNVRGYLRFKKTRTKLRI